VTTALVVLVVLAISQRKRLWGWRRRSEGGLRGRREDLPIFRLYQTTLRRLAAAGAPRMPSETPHEFLARIEAARAEGWQTLARLTDLYTSARYGEVAISPEVLADLRQAVNDIRLAS
jgi:hypothetical protein